LKVCLVIPTFNERENIAPLLDRVKSVAIPDLHVLFVDDSSPDGTAEAVERAMARSPNVHLVKRPGKLGIGSAHVQGFAWALSNLSPEALVEMDSDLQHPPEKIPDLLKAVEGGADVAIASRKVQGGGTEGWSRWRMLVSSGANALARIVLGLGVKDSTSGFRALNAKAAKVVIEAAPSSNSYFFQVESLYALKTRGLKMVEVPFVFTARQTGRSKMGVGEIVGFFFGVWRLRFS
jgi:dolichol-phosphate mannosyltransferase